MPKECQFILAKSRKTLNHKRRLIVDDKCPIVRVRDRERQIAELVYDGDWLWTLRLGVEGLSHIGGVHNISKGMERACQESLSDP